MRKAALVLGALLLLVGGLALVEQRHGYITGYDLGRFGRVRSPSLRMDLAQILGLRSFYSQMGQDKWILGVVFPGVEDGYFVDVGAWDAVRFSNSKALEESGWRGVCVEPFPRNWRGRRCRLFEEVVYSHAGEVVRFRRAGVVSGIEAHAPPREGPAPGPVVELTTTTLADVLERAGAPEFIHYVSIDTEGSELEILQGFPFSRHQVGAFTIEHNHEEVKRRGIRALLRRHGYRFAREQAVDDWYVRADPP